MFGERILIQCAIEVGKTEADNKNCLLYYAIQRNLMSRPIENLCVGDRSGSTTQPQARCIGAKR